MESSADDDEHAPRLFTPGPDTLRERSEEAAVIMYDVGGVPMSSIPSAHDDQMAAQFERIIRRVKHSMNYRGSYSTRDILGSLVARWVHSGEWQRLKTVAPEQRHIGESVRRFILDRMDHVRRRGEHLELVEEIVLPDETTLVEMIELAELRAWIDARVGDLENGVVDPRVRIPVADATQLGRALRLHLAGRTQRAIAAELEISLGLANRRIAEGTNYLVVLQGIEQGIGVGD
jgi:hypothetical protein